MVSAFLFIIHGLAAIGAFFYYKRQGASEGWLAVAFVAIVFSVAWVIATMLTNLIFLPDFFVKWYYQPLDSNFWVIVRKEINRDAISLIILTLGEWGFYRLYFGGNKEDAAAELPSPTSIEK